MQDPAPGGAQAKGGSAAAPGRIRTGALDRVFYSVAVVSCLQEAGIQWLMPRPNTPHVKDAP